MGTERWAATEPITRTRGPAVEEEVWAVLAGAQKETRLDLWKGAKAVEEVVVGREGAAVPMVG